MKSAPLRHQLLWALLIIATTTSAQSSLDDYSFYRQSNIPVFQDYQLPQPWVGGLNAIRFFEIDLDFDGVNDLLAFEKHGNRILPFLNHDNDFIFAPELVHQFPPLHDWMLLCDYNRDGRPDIFTYGLAGIAVYENVSENAQLAFRLKCEQLNAFYYNGYVNIFAAPTDHPIIEDIDGDGHLDILNFWVLGKYVHHLRNASDDPNIFDFQLVDECWGHFSESADDNGIALFTDCDSKDNDNGLQLRHTGSTMLLHDFDGNGLPDLLLGDMDFPNLVLLYNNGTLTDARMTAKDTAFPASAPIHLFSMPTASFFSLPGNSHQSLIVAPADPSLNKSQDIDNVWQYNYNELLGQYTKTSQSFLQEEMIDVGSGCLPVLYDWDEDGLTDLFLANYGSFDSTTITNGTNTFYHSSSISYYKNIGTVDAPIFQLITSDFGTLKILNRHALYPTFGDFDGDGLTDILCGLEDGTLMLVPHDRLLGHAVNTTENFQNIDVGKFSTPQYFDLDQDGRKDLVIGNQRGLVSYFRNTSESAIPVFEHVTDTLGGIDVCNHDQSYYGYSVPCCYRDSTHGTVLFCGCESGNLFYYKDIDNNIDGIFSQSIISEADNATCDHCTHLLREGIRSGCTIFPLHSEEYPDLIVGNYAGGVAYFAGRIPTQTAVGIVENESSEWHIFPNPATDDIHISSTFGESVHTIRIYDLTGRICLLSHEEPIDIRALMSGAYIVEINGKSKTKLIISKSAN